MKRTSFPIFVERKSYRKWGACSRARDRLVCAERHAIFESLRMVLLYWRKYTRGIMSRASTDFWSDFWGRIYFRGFRGRTFFRGKHFSVRTSTPKNPYILRTAPKIRTMFLKYAPRSQSTPPEVKVRPQKSKYAPRKSKYAPKRS